MLAMSQSSPSLVNSRLKQANRRGIVVEVVGFRAAERNRDVCLGDRAGIDAAIADVCDLEATAPAVFEKPDPIIRRQAADLKIRAQTTPGSAAAVPR